MLNILLFGLYNVRNILDGNGRGRGRNNHQTIFYACRIFI